MRRRHQRTHVRRAERARRTVRRFQNIGMHSLRVVRKWGLLMTFFIGACLFLFLAFSPVVQVREIRVQRSDPRLDIEKVQKALSPLFGRHLLFLPRYEVNEILTETVPDILEVQTNKNYPSELVVRIQLRPVLARLTIETPQQFTVQSGGVIRATPQSFQYDYVTDNGIYVVSPQQLSGSTHFIVRDWTLRPVPGTQILSPEKLLFLRDSEAALQQEFSKRVTGRVIYMRAQEVHLQLGNISVWFDARSPLAGQLERLRTFVQAVGWGEARQYVDLRLAGRIVYR